MAQRCMPIISYILLIVLRDLISGFQQIIINPEIKQYLKTTTHIYIYIYEEENNHPYLKEKRKRKERHKKKQKKSKVGDHNF